MPISSQLKELLLQSLAHERGGVLVYETALECAQNEDLREEWTEYLDQTRRHVEVLTRACSTLALNPAEETPGVQVVQHTGQALVQAMKMAQAAGDPVAAELVACECVVLAETKDHADWELIGLCAKGAKAMPPDQARVLQEAYDAVEDEEDEHLYHTQGWCRELWVKSLGFEAMLPPPEEEQDVKSMMQAAKARKTRRESVRH